MRKIYVRGIQDFQGRNWSVSIRVGLILIVLEVTSRNVQALQAIPTYRIFLVENLGSRPRT